MTTGNQSFDDARACERVHEPGSAPSCSRRIAELETQVAQLTTANAILRRMAALLLAPGDRPSISSAAETP